MKIWNLNTGEEDSTWSVEQVASWIERNHAECLFRIGDGTWRETVSVWRTWESPYTSEIWRVEP